jgi:hypothetical protein
MTNALGDQQAQPPNNPPIPKLFSASRSLEPIPFQPLNQAHRHFFPSKSVT